MRKILSIDGGGIRGIIPACTLVALEQQIGKPVRECFDFVAGTSTGALLAAAAAAGVPAPRILDIYTARSKEIFTPPQPIADAERAIKGYMYDPANIQKVLISEFGSAAAWVMNDSPIDVLLTAKGIDTHPWYFVKDKPKNGGITGNLRLIDCATASASAPTYFKPWTMQIDGKATVLVDGGVGVTGNPVYQACVEAFYYDDYSPTDTLVVSLGTGFYPTGNTVPEGMIGWLKWSVNTMLDAPEDQQPMIVNLTWPGIMKRFDWQLTESIDMADTSKIPDLVQIGQKAAAGMDWHAILGV